MEIIEVNGYTQEEKLQIANRHLLPKQFKENGVKAKQLKLARAAGGHHRPVHRRERRAHLGKAHRQAGALPRQADRVETEAQASPSPLRIW
jgi:ATP-dependent Lon protease